MAYRRSTIGSSGYGSPGFGASDPMGDALAGTPEAMSPDQGFLSEDADLRTAAAYEYTRDRSQDSAISDGGSRPWYEESLVGLAARALPLQDTWAEAAVENLGARAGELVLGIPELAGAGLEAAGLVDDGQAWQDWKFGGDSTVREQVEAVFGSRELINERYADYSWESLKQDWNDPNTSTGQNIKNVAELIVTQGPASLVDAYFAAKHGMKYVLTRTGEMTAGRKESTGEDTNFGDIAIAAATATAVRFSEKFGFDTIMMNNPWVKKTVDKASSNLVKRLIGAGIGGAAEGTTEYGQEFVEALAEGVKQDLSNLGEVADQAVVDALAGAIVGSGVGTVMGGLNTPTGVEETAAGEPGTDLAAGANEGTPAPEVPPNTQMELPLGIPEGLPGPGPGPALSQPEPAAPEPEATPPGQLDLFDQQQELPLQQPTPAPTPEPEPQGAAMELQPGVLDDGQQDALAAPQEPMELPEGADEASITNDLRTQALRGEQDAKRGAELRDTGFGQLVEQAVRAKNSVQQIEKIKNETLTNQEKLEKQLRRVTDAKENAPGPKLINIAENLARLTYAEAQAVKGRATKSPKVAAQREQLFNALITQTDRMQGLAEQVKKTVTDPAGSGSVNALIGAIARNAAPLNAMGIDIMPLVQAETPVEARKALDTVDKQVKNLLIGARNEGADLQLPPRISLDENLEGQVDPKSREIKAVRAETERQGQASGKSTVPTMRPEALNAYETTDEEGNVRTTLAVDPDSYEAKERRRLIRQRDAAEERRKFGTITNYERQTIDELPAIDDEGNVIESGDERGSQYTDVVDEGDNVVLPAQDVTIGEGDNARTVSAQEAAGERKRAPTSSKAKLRKQLIKVRGKEVAERELANKLLASKERLAAAERATKEVKREDPGAMTGETKRVGGRDSGSASGTIDKPNRGVSKARVKAAGKVFNAYKRAHSKGKKRTTPPGTIVARAAQTKSQTISKKGLPSLLVFNKNFTDRNKDSLFWVRGAYPSREIIRGKDGRITKVKRATPHQPGDPAPYSFLRKRTFFLPDQVVAVRGNSVYTFAESPGQGGPSVERAQLPESDRTIQPEEMDSLLEFLGKQDFEWEGQPDELAMAQYLLDKTKPSKTAATTPRTPEAQILDELEEEAAAQPTPETDGDGVEIEFVEDPDEDFDVDAFAEMFEGYGEGEGTDADYESLSQQVRDKENAVNAAKLELDTLEQIARETPIVDDKLSVTPHAAWPLSRSDFNVQRNANGTITDPYEVITYEQKDGVSVDEAMVQGIVEQAKGQLAAEEIILADLKRKLEEANERRGESPPSGRKNPKGKPTPEGAEQVPAADGTTSDDTAGGTRRTDDDRVPGVERVDPGTRVPTDLYEGARKKSVLEADAVNRARSLVDRGPDGRDNLNEEQVKGIALGFQAWKQAAKDGVGGFLNMDGTGFGKARQVAGLGKLIGDAEAEAGTNRPILIMFPGGAANWTTKAGRPALTNDLGDNIVGDMVALGIDPRATYSDGTPRYDFRPYNSLQRANDTEYAAVLADEAHEVKGSGKQAQGFDALNSPYRAFFTATPTDMAGQEVYYLKHLARRAGETLDQAMTRVTNRLNLQKAKNAKGNDTWQLGSGAILSDFYLQRLDSLLDPLVKAGRMVSRTFGRISKNYALPATSVDEKAEALYNQLLADGWNPNDDVMIRLTEHMKVPYMVERTIKRVTQDNNKVIAVFTSTNPSKNQRLIDAGLAEPAIDRFTYELAERGIPTGKLAGDAKSADAAYIEAFQGTETNAGTIKVMAVSDSRGSTGLNLNDKWGDSPRYMLVNMTGMRGERFMQLLGRHDRNNNRSVPYTEFVKVNNQTDRNYRNRVADKIRLQERISGVERVQDQDPGKFERQIYQLEEFLNRTRSASRIEDAIDQVVLDMVRGGRNGDIRNLLHTIAVGAKDDQLAALATDLLNVRGGWNEVSVRMMRPGERLNSSGTYYTRTGEIALNDERGAAQTLLHELTHHMTHIAISNDPRAQQELDVIRSAMLQADRSLAERFPNAFSNQYEFIAEAFSDPDFQYELHKTFIDSGKKLSMFQRFLRWVQQLLGVTDESYNALEKIVDLDLFRYDGEFDVYNAPLHKQQPPRMLHRKMQRRAQRLENWKKKVNPRATGAWHKVRKGMIWSMTYDQIVDTYKHLAQRTNNSAKPDNVLEDMVAVQEAISSQSNKNNKRYSDRVIDPLKKFAQGKGKDIIKVRMNESGPIEEMTQLEYLSHLMNISGYAGIHFGKPLADKANAMAKKDAKGNVPRPEAKAAWDVHSKQANRKEFAEAMQLYNSLAQFFEGDRQKKAQIIAGAYLDTLYPNAKLSWTQRSMKDINAELKRIGNMSTADMKDLGASKDAMDDLKTMLKPGVVPGAYFPLKRYGDYVVVVEGDFQYIDDAQRDAILRKYPNGKEADGMVKIKTVARFETAAEAARFREEQVAKYNGVEEVGVNQVELKYATNEDMLGATSFSALANNFNTQLAQKVEDQKQRETMRTLFAQAMLDMMPETSAANAMRARQGIDGASLDIQRVLHQYGTSQGYMMANLQYSRQQNILANDLRQVSGELVGEDQIALEQVRQALMARNNAAAKGPMDLGRIGQKLSDVGFLYYLVGFSYNLVNATQPALVTTPYLGARYGVAKTAAAMTNAYKVVGGAPVKELWRTKGSLTQLKGLFSGKDFNRDDYDILHGKDGILENVADPNHKKMLEILEDEGHIEASLAMDMSRMSERSHVNPDGTARPATAWDYLTDWMRTFPHITEVMNRSVTAVAAFDLEYAKSKDFDKATTAARKAVKQTQFVYQNWNKPPAFQNPAGRTVLMFKQHVQHMYYYMIRNAAQSFNGATPEEKAVGRKAITYFVITHMAGAGIVGGTPELVKWIINLAFWAFGDEDEPFEYDRFVRNTMYDMFGKPGATLASQGLPGFIGLDLSGRIGIDSMLMFEAPDTSSNDGFLADIVRIAGGPMVGLAERGISLKNAYHTGDYYRMAEAALPKALRDPVKAVRYSQQGYRDLSGKTYRDAEDVSWLEFGYKAIGFSPTKESDTYQSRAVGQTRQKMETKKRRLYTRFYNADTPEQKREVLEDIRAWNQDNPDFAITRSNLIRSVKQRRRQEALTEKGVYTPKTQRGWVREEQRSY